MTDTDKDMKIILSSWIKGSTMFIMILVVEESFSLFERIISIQYVQSTYTLVHMFSLTHHLVNTSLQSTITSKDNSGMISLHEDTVQW